MNRKEDIYIEVHPMDYVLHKDLWAEQLESYELTGTPIYTTISIPRKHARFVNRAKDYDQISPMKKPKEWDQPIKE